MEGSEFLAPFARLEELFRAEMEKMGAKTVHFSFSAVRREVTILLDLDDDLFLTEQQRDDRDVLAEMERSLKEQSVPDKTTEVLSKLDSIIEDEDE